MQPGRLLAEKREEGTCDARNLKASSDRLLEQVQLPVQRASVVLPSSRRVEIEAGESDTLTVRASDGRLLVSIELTDTGPRLRLESAELNLHATRRVSIAAEEVAIDAQRALSISSGGDLSERVAGNHYTHISGDERLEAASVQLQANRRALSLRAIDRIALDGEHIGLNDDPCPQPFPWSTLAADGKSAATDE